MSGSPRTSGPAASRREPWAMTAAELARAYCAGTLSPVAATHAVLARLDAVNPALNAVVTCAGQQALEAALQSERRWRAGTPLSPLDGVPFTVKDNIPVAGMRSTFGSRLYADHVPQADELPVARLRAAGAIPLGKTNVPELALHGYTGNEVFGVTRNPWNPALTPGGSSGGAVAAVAAGIAPLAIATDGGGSIRRPCMHAGVAGLKPSLGRVPRAHGFPAFLHDFEVIGPVARSVEDLALAMQLISMPDPADSRSDVFERRPFALPGTVRPARIRVLSALGDAAIDAEIRAGVAAAAQTFANLGHAVGTEEMPDLVEAISAINAEAWPVVSQAGLAWFMAAHFPQREGELSAPVAQLLAAGKSLPASAYQQALSLVAALRNRLAALFQSCDYLLLPSAAAQAWPAEQTHPAVIDGTPVGPRGHAVFTAFVNAAGLPAIALPAGLSCTGLPLGFQLVGRHGADDALCALGMQYEKAAPWPLSFSESRFSGNPGPFAAQLAALVLSSTHSSGLRQAGTQSA